MHRPRGTCRLRSSYGRCGRKSPLGLSALMTTTMPQQRVIEALKEAGLRDSVKVMVGGAPVSREWAERIGADGYGEDAIEAVAEAKKLLGIKEDFELKL